MRKPPAGPPAPAVPPADDGRLEDALAGSGTERRRKAALYQRIRTQVGETARARGEDPYEMLARAIRQLLRS